MSNFGELISNALFERNKSIKDLEDNKILAKNSFYSFGKNVPSLESMIKIANFLQLSIDYILDRSTENNFKKYKIDQSKFFNNLEKFRIAENLPKTKFCEKLGISRTNFSRWKNGTQPSLTKLIELADFFGCDIDDLLERE